MSRPLRPLAALAVVATAAAISAGCGGSGSSGGTSTAAPASTTDNGPNPGNGNSTASNTGTGGKKNATARDTAVKFAACMRENGYADFPDPKASGEFPSFGISVSPGVWTRALLACKELQPPGSFNPHMSSDELSAARKFAECIRADGVKDFPDPVQDRPIVDTTKIPSANRPGGMAILNAAMHKCGHLVARETGGQGGTGG